MFERALLLPKGSGLRFRSSFEGQLAAPVFPAPFRAIPLQDIAETMVFYDSVEISDTPGNVALIIENMGESAFTDLYKSGRLKISLSPSTGLTHFDDPKNGWTFSINRTDYFSRTTIQQKLDTRSMNTAATLLFDDEAEIQRHSLEKDFYDKVLEQSAEKPDTLNDLLRAYLADRYPNDSFASLQVHYAGMPLQDGRHFFHLEFENSIVEGSRFEDPIFAIAGILANVVKASASDREFATDLVTANSIKQIAQAAIQRAVPQSQIRAFEEFVLRGHAIGPAVVSYGDAGQGFERLTDLLEKKGRFSKWLGEQKPGTGLVQAWIDHLSSESWIDKLPFKSFRFGVFAGLGLLADAGAISLGLPPGVGTGAGVGVGAFDSLLIDKIRKGWSPNQFVNELTELAAGRAGKLN